MTLESGTRIGPFEVGQRLDAGGMAEIWRARDTRLGREVAIKALTAAFAQDAERLARFEPTGGRFLVRTPSENAAEHRAIAVILGWAKSLDARKGAS